MLLTIYIISFIISITPYIVYLSTGKLDDVDQEILDLFKVSFVMSMFPAINTFFSVFLLILGAINVLNSLEEMIKG